MKRYLLLLCLAILPGATLASTEALLLGVNEGAAEQEAYSAIQRKYQGLADYLSRVLKRPVHLESSQNLKHSASNLKKDRYDLFYARPANVAALAIRDEKFQLVAMVKGEFAVNFIVKADSPLKKPDDIKGKRIALARNTLMGNAGLAELRDRGLTPGGDRIQSAQYQEAVAFMVEKGFADVGMVAPMVSKEWTAKGGRVLFQSRKMPFWCLLASPKLSTQDVEAMRTALLHMDESDDGKKILEQMGVKGFVPGNPQEYLDLLAWIQKK